MDLQFGSFFFNIFPDLCPAICLHPLQSVFSLKSHFLSSYPLSYRVFFQFSSLDPLFLPDHEQSAVQNKNKHANKQKRPDTQTNQTLKGKGCPRSKPHPHPHPHAWFINSVLLPLDSLLFPIQTPFFPSYPPSTLVSLCSPPCFYLFFMAAPLIGLQL